MGLVLQLGFVVVVLTGGQRVVVGGGQGGVVGGGHPQRVVVVGGQRGVVGGGHPQDGTEALGSACPIRSKPTGNATIDKDTDHLKPNYICCYQLKSW